VRLDTAEIAKKDEASGEVQMKNNCLVVPLNDLYFERLSDLVMTKNFDSCVINTATHEGVEGVIEMFLTDLTEDGHEHEHGDECGAGCGEEGIVMNDMAPLDTIVCIVDAKTFMNDFTTVDSLVDRFKEAIPEEEDKNIASLIVEQIETSTTILINNADSAEDIKTVESLIRKINATAKIFNTKNSEVSTKDVLNTGLFSLEDKSSQTPAWLKEIRGEIPSNTVGEFSSFVYKRRIPFNTEKIFNFLYGSDYLNKDSGVVRSKGFCWLCTRNEDCGDWDHVSQIVEIAHAGRFYASLDAETREMLGEEVAKESEANSEGEHGDRRIELLFIGKNMNQKEIESKLDACLITKEELAKGSEVYSTICKDEFPEWATAMDLNDFEDDEEEDDEEEGAAEVDITTTPKRKRDETQSSSKKSKQ